MKAFQNQGCCWGGLNKNNILNDYLWEKKSRFIRLLVFLTKLE